MQKFITSDCVTKEHIKEHDTKWTQIPDHPYRILIVGGSESGKTNSLFDLIGLQPDADKIHWYAKDPCEAKYQFLTKKRQGSGLKHSNDSKAFMNISMIWLIFMKVLKNTIQIKNAKYWLYLMICMLCLVTNKFIQINRTIY